MRTDTDMSKTERHSNVHDACPACGGERCRVYATEDQANAASDHEALEQEFADRKCAHCGASDVAGNYYGENLCIRCYAAAGGTQWGNAREFSDLSWSIETKDGREVAIPTCPDCGARGSLVPLSDDVAWRFVAEHAPDCSWLDATS